MTITTFKGPVRSQGGFISGAGTVGNVVTAETNPLTGGVVLASSVKPKSAITVALDGSGDFTSLADVVKYLDSFDVDGKSLIIVTIKAGHYSLSDYLLISQHIYFNVFFNGEAINGLTVSSIDATSGSAGAWLHTLNINSAADILVGDWLLVSATAGGVNPTFLAGAAKVTAVNLALNKVTIESKHPNATPASGAVSGNLVVLKTVLNFPAGKNGIQVWNGATLGQVNNLMVVGAGGAQGISVQDNGRLLVGAGHLGVSGFNTNIVVTQSGQMTTVGQVSTANGVFANIAVSTGGGQLDFGSGSVCSNSGVYGIYTADGGQFRMAGGFNIITGCPTGVSAIRGATATLDSNVKVTGCSTVGVYVREGGWANGTTPQLASNVKDFDIAHDFGGIKLKGPYPIGATEIGTMSYESGGNWRNYIGVNSGSYKYVLSSRTGSVTTDLFRWVDNGHYQELSKEVVSTALLTAVTVTKKNTYLTGAAGASLAVTLPNAGSTIDGQKMTIMSSTDRPSTTWISGGGGAFVGAPTSLVAGVPVTLQYDQASAKWYPTH